jgi:hypothetical protein
MFPSPSLVCLAAFSWSPERPVLVQAPLPEPELRAPGLASKSQEPEGRWRVPWSLQERASLLPVQASLWWSPVRSHQPEAW